MVLLLHEQRYSAYSLLSCKMFCLFDSTFVYLTIKQHQRYSEGSFHHVKAKFDQIVKNIGCI